MLIEKLNRELWSFDQAKTHVASALLPLCQAQILEQQAASSNRRPEWSRPEDPVKKSHDEARRELMIALRDGDLHATGRLSTQRRERYAAGYSIWDFHSGYPQPISPAHWREGQLGYLNNNLEYLEGEFIDIRVPRFMVLAIWPEPQVQEKTQIPGTVTPYTTPYLDLMKAAIRQYGLSVEQQDKKESLVAWFLEQEVESEPLSRNLAEAMATLIRMPSAQRGGAKRMIGPDLRDTG